MAGRQLRNFLQQAPRGQQSYGPLMPDADPIPEGVVSEAEFWQGRDPNSVVRESEYFRTPEGHYQFNKNLDPNSVVRDGSSTGWTWENLARALSPEALQELAKIVLLNKIGDPDSNAGGDRILSPAIGPEDHARLARTLPATPVDMTGRDRQEFMQTLPATHGDMTEQERQDFMQQLRGRDPNSVVRESEYQRGRRGR